MSAEFWRDRKVVVTGGQGFVGSKVMARLAAFGARPVSCSRRSGCDLRSLDRAVEFFRQADADIVINCASRQGGIGYQKLYAGEIFYDNLLMGANTLEAARRAGVRKYVNLVAGCAYPGDPRDGILREDEFEAGPMHETVENYGATKRAAVAMARAYRKQYGFVATSLILVNLYGPGEHFHPDRSHALAALLRKFYEARRDGRPEVVLWGTGRGVREWLFVEDAAEGIVRAAERYDEVEPLNLAVGQGQPMSELAALIAEIVGYRGAIVYDTSKSDGALRKTGDVEKMRQVLGWQPATPLADGIRQTLAWFVENYEQATALEPAAA